MSDAAALLDTLDRAGYHMTDPRRRMAEMVAARTGRFTAEDLVREAREERSGIGRATVFRSLEIFEALGLVERVHLARGEHAYVTCEPARHHHHLVCERCGRSTEIRDVEIGPIVRSIEAGTGYVVDSHRIEFFGVCPDCQAATDESA